MNKITISILVLLSVFLVACGGGGGETLRPEEKPKSQPETPAVPTPPANPPSDPPTTPDAGPNPQITPTPPPPPPPPAPELPPAPPVPAILSFSSSELCVVPSAPVSLTWGTGNASEVTLTEYAGLGNSQAIDPSTPLAPDQTQSVDPSGNRMISITAPTTFLLRAKNADQETRQQITIQVRPQHMVLETRTSPFPGGPFDDLSRSMDGTTLGLKDGLVYKKGPNDNQFIQLSPDSHISQWEAVEVDPTNPAILYAATRGWIFRSTDGGATWPDLVILERNLVSLTPQSLFILSYAPHLVFIGLEGTAALLDTRARSLNFFLNPESIFAFAVTPDHPDLVIAGDDRLHKASLGFASRPVRYTTWNGGDVNDLLIVGETVFVAGSGGLFSVGLNQTAFTNEGVTGPVYKLLKNVQTGSIYAATESGLYMKGGNGWNNLFSQPIHWLFDVGGRHPLAITENSQVSFEEVIQFGECLDLNTSLPRDSLQSDIFR